MRKKCFSLKQLSAFTGAYSYGGGVSWILRSAAYAQTNVRVFAGQSHSLIIKSDGTLWASATIFTASSATVQGPTG
jgi:hypothetical protein